MSSNIVTPAMGGGIAVAEGRCLKDWAVAEGRCLKDWDKARN